MNYLKHLACIFLVCDIFRQFSCYEFLANRVTYSTALSNCQEKGARLAEVFSDSVKRELMSHAQGMVLLFKIGQVNVIARY